MPLHIDLIDRGYFPVEIPPAFSTSSLASASGYLPSNLDSFAAKSSRCAFHSIPRLLHHRRLLGIPNRLHQFKLVVILEKHWMDLEAVAGELLFRPFFLRIPTQCNNVTLGRKRLNRVFCRHRRHSSM